jgi:DNA polymerase-3 subunit delta'
MKFEAFLGNQKVIARLRLKLREGRFPHAVIFAGPEGVGKRTCALMIAKSLNCTEGPPGDFCDACVQCRKIEGGVHPDVIRVGIEEDASDIKIAQIRQVLETLSLRPLEGKNKIFIIDPASAMNASAANALLKGLEEPPENSYFVLLTPNLQELLITVRSRSQHYHFTPLTEEQLRPLASDDLALRWSRGSVGILKTLDLAALKPKREVILNFLEAAAGAQEAAFRDLLSASAELARSKNDFDTYLEMLAIILEDLLYIGQELPDRIVNTDIRPRLARLASRFSSEQFIQISEFLLVMESSVKGHVNRQMLTDVLALTASEIVTKIAHDNSGKSR